MKKISSEIKVLLLITVVAIFLRAYNFHDWLRFSMDQSRDAFLVSSVVDGKSAWPLLGPLAGGTSFHLGPAYYYFSILSAKIFGNYPDKMAYPSLIFAILAVPLLYFFLREYFSGKISLMLVFLMSVSYFFIETSRFSSNPNLIPFFVILFLWSFLRVINDAKIKNWWWPLLAGIALGIGVQLHTTLLVIMPVVALILSFYALKKNGWRCAKFLAAIFLCAALLNAPQIIHELRTDWSNTRQFIVGLEEKGAIGENRWNEIKTTAICQAKANLFFVSSVPITETCSKKINYGLKYGSRELYPDIKNGHIRKTIFVAELFFLWIFFAGGYLLLGLRIRKESKAGKKNFLFVIAVFNFVSLIFLFPIIYSLSVSYFNIIFFIPFVFLGLAFEFLENKIGDQGKKIIWILFAIFVAVSFVADKKAFRYYSKGLDNNADNSDLREIESISNYILDNSTEQQICFSGEKAYFERFSRPVSYLVRNEREWVEENIHDIADACSEKQIFYVKNKSTGKSGRKKIVNDLLVREGEKFKNTEVYILENNQNTQ